MSAVPATLLAGRVRTTTVVLAVAFLGTLALYLAVRPPPVLPARSGDTTPAVVVPQPSPTRSPSRAPAPSPSPERPSPVASLEASATPSVDAPAAPSPSASVPAAPSPTEVLPSPAVPAPVDEPSPSAG